MTRGRELTFDVVRAEQLDEAGRTEIIRLCATAFAEDFDDLFEVLPGSVHVRARLAGSGELVGHAAWVTRWLQPQRHEPLRTAYVEAVATASTYQKRGFGTDVMRRVAANIGDYDLGALSPADARFYERLGWEMWRGPLAIRTDGGLLRTPDEEVMAHLPQFVFAVLGIFLPRRVLNGTIDDFPAKHGLLVLLGTWFRLKWSGAEAARDQESSMNTALFFKAEPLEAPLISKTWPSSRENKLQEATRNPECARL